MLGLNACYTTRPLTGFPAPETRVRMDLTDQGRVVYGERIGSSVLSVGGVVESASDSAYVVRINRVWYLNGKTDTWSGERVSFAPQYLARVQQHEPSRSRTALVAVAAVAGVAALVATIGLIGGSFGSSRDDPGKGGGGEQ